MAARSYRLGLARVALSPLFVVAFVLGAGPGAMGAAGRWAALLIVVLFEATEALEARAGRGRHPTWDLGQLFPPVGYAVSRFTVLLCLVWGGYVALWMVVVVFFRDVFVSYVRVAAIRSGKGFGARLSRTVKAVAQGVATVAILGLIAATPRVDPFAVARTVTAAQWLMGLVVTVALVSGWDCVRSNLAMVRSLMAHRA